MQKTGTHLLFSPSDLITFMSDPFSSWMDRRFIENPEGMTPDKPDESALLVQKRGILHERDFLESLIADGKDVCTILERREEALAETIAAMKAGREIIYQGYLAKENFAGLSDFLIRQTGTSKFGDYCYEVWDSKLARKPKPYFLVQLCAYAEMLEFIQGTIPQSVAIVFGNKEIRTFRTADYYFFYQSLKERFLAFQNAFDYYAVPEWPNVGEHSRWKTDATRLLEKRDDLLRVANIRKSQIKKMKAAGIDTLTGLARSEERSVAGISQSAFDTLKAQARLQLESKPGEKPLFEIVPNDPNDKMPRGLHALPPSSDLDVFFDMEGFPFLEGGLEYLFGATTLGQERFLFDDWWAHNRSEEKSAFQKFIDWTHQRWQKDPQMHVYHYGAYEVSAMRRLASRHATRETELDEMLRAELFVDLYAIVRQGIRIGAESYSIKKVELLYMDKRHGDVSKATDSIVYYERWLEQQDGSTWADSNLLADIREYNKLDCESTALLCAWLRDQQNMHEISYTKKSTKSTAPVNKPATPNELMAEQLRALIPKDRSQDPERWRITELLADLLGFHSRERKVGWWEFFDRAELSEEELALDPECIANVRRVPKEPILLAKSFIFEYSFDAEQDLKLQSGDTVAFAHETSSKAEIHSIDEDDGIVKLKLSEKKSEEAPLPESGNLILMESVNNGPLEDSILRQAKRFLVDGNLNPCIDDLLRREIPRLHGLNPGDPICPPDAELVDVAGKMANTYLCVQGPPGTGKTYQAANSIIDLMKKGKRIAVCSNSHKAIENLLEEIGIYAKKKAFTFNGAKVNHDKSGKPEFSNDDIKVLSDAKAVKSLDELQLVGATAWFFAKELVNGKFDYLFVDEAGQVCLANILAMADCCKNIVLIGDQLQLEQPVRGSHPGESGLSSLDYLLGEAATISPDRGIFLSTTRRMHPELCRSISEAVYDGRLHSDRITTARWLTACRKNPDHKDHATIPDSIPGSIPGSIPVGATPCVAQSRISLEKTNGLIYLPIEHQGNSQSSIEEVAYIESIIKELLSWDIAGEPPVSTVSCPSQQAQPNIVDPGNRIPNGNPENDYTRKLSIEDILVVAPYNKQVRLIKSRIPNVIVGSVDKFQGRQAPVVILSMTASDLASSARGLEFLLSKRRLNVAISRAKLLSIVVGSPSFAEFQCSTVEQAALLNFYCRLMQEGKLKKPETCVARSS